MPHPTKTGLAARRAQNLKQRRALQSLSASNGRHKNSERRQLLNYFGELNTATLRAIRNAHQQAILNALK